MSPPELPSLADLWRIGVSARADLPPHACEVSEGKRRGVGALSGRSGSDRHAWRATEWGRLPGRAGADSACPCRGSRGPAVRRRGHSSRLLVAMSSALNRSGCCDDCTEWMYWMTRTGLPAWKPCRVGTPWVASVCGEVRHVRRPHALWSHRGAGARMPIPLGEESA